MKRYVYRCLFFTLFVAALCSCSDEENGLINNHLGESYYHEGFLWMEEETSFAENIITLDFNNDAKDYKSKATISFVDEQEKPLDMRHYIILINGIKLNSPEVSINTNQSEVYWNIACTPDVEEGTKTGYILLKAGHTLDRVGETSVENGKGNVKIAMWNFDYVKHIHPVEAGIRWGLLVIFAALAIWRLLLRRHFFKPFRAVTKTFNIPGQAPLLVKMNGQRMVVVSNKKGEQSLFDKFFKGNILYKVHPAFELPIILKPSGKGRRKIMVKADYSKYRINPNPMPNIGSAEIIILSNNTKITIQ